MRISTLKDDPGFKNFTCPMDVYLNGNLMQHCVTADDDLGLVVVLKTNQSTEQILINEGGDLEYQEFRGLVRIEPKPNL